MRQIYTFLAGTLIIFSSCSSTQKVAQTPDDVYYSGGTKVASSGSSSDDQPEYYSTRPSDQYVQMKSQDYDKWSYFDDYNSYSPYYAPSGLSMGMGMGYGYYPSYGYGLGFGGASFGLGFADPYMCWNSYYMWNSWYNPYFFNPYYGGGVIIVNPKGTIGGGGVVYNHPRTFIPTSYRSVTSGTSTSDRFYRPAGNLSTTQYNRNVRNGNGNTYRSSNNNNSYRPTYNSNNNQPVRSYSPAPSFGGGTRSVGGGGGGGFSRPGRN